MFIVMPKSNLWVAVLSMVIYAVGYGSFMPLIQYIMAEASDGMDRAGIYAFRTVMVSVMGTLMGAASGNIYSFNPILIFVLAILILLSCMVLLLKYRV